MGKSFLFALWAGGGAVPPALSVARALRERGHAVRALADRSLHDEVAAAGAEPIAWTTAPQGDTCDPAKDILKDFEARALDYPGRRFPAHVRHVGPRLDDPAWAGKREPELPAGDAPLALVGLSSSFMNQRRLLERIAEALGTLPVRALLTTGPAVAPETVRAPGNVLVTAAASHSMALRHTAVTITHAGHGTAVKSLAAGVPLVCIPQGRDQAEVARHVELTGAGITVGENASPRTIARAVSRVLHDPSYQREAQRLATEISAETATDRAVFELEALAERTARRREGAPGHGAASGSART